MVFNNHENIIKKRNVADKMTVKYGAKIPIDFFLGEDGTWLRLNMVEYDKVEEFGCVE